MRVYNIRKAKFADKLRASGVANRWNKDDEFVIYTGSSIALSTLELIAHRHSIDVQSGYKVMSLQINVRPSEIKTIEEKDLPKNWKSIVSYPLLQEIGSNWYHSKKELILKVPSAIIPKEHNYLLNTHHPDFDKKISIETVEDFYWDKRLL